MFGKTFTNVVGLCARGPDAVRRYGSLWAWCDSLWVPYLTRCEGVGLAVSISGFLAVSRVTGDFGRPCAVGV